MGSVGEIAEEPALDVEETIFVAVGKHLESSKTTLFWAAENFVGKKICVVHVHQPAQAAALTYKKLYSSRFSRNSVWAYGQGQQQSADELLNEHLLLLHESGVRADKLWIVTDNVEKGIVELVARYGIRWLVMGAASDKHYSRKMTGLKSNKAISVCHEAPKSCHIWFVCNSCLIYTRAANEDRDERNFLPPLLVLDSNIERMQSAKLQRANATRNGGSPRPQDAGEDSEEVERELCASASQGSWGSYWSTSDVVGNDVSSPLSDEEGPYRGQVTHEIHHIRERRNFKRMTFEEALKRWKEEDRTMEAKCKAKVLENLCAKEMTHRKELEELVEKEQQEIERMTDLHDETIKNLQRVRDESLQLESLLTKSQCSTKDLEEKIISAVELLISFRKQRDEMRIENQNAKRAVKALGKLVLEEVGGSYGAQILEFSFMEISDATNELDQECKIGEGDCGSVYGGLLRHLPVAIKMLPSYGSESLSEFRSKVAVLSRVRHPNLATLIGSCPESRSLVFDYLRNGSLEDRLSCKDNTPPLSCQTRTRIALEICSALIFLHSNKPPMAHGNLKASKVLLDSHFVCKLIDYGFYHLIRKEDNAANSVASFDEPNHRFSYAPTDPNDSETESVIPGSDVYGFGIILLQLLTRRQVPTILRDVRCALDNDIFDTILDNSAGDWPVAQARKVAQLALRCCEKNRPRLSEISGVLELMKSSCITSSARSASREPKRVPSHFLCPIFQEVMSDPLIATDGFTYEADAIRGWLHSGHNTSPMTNLKLNDCSLVPNHALHEAIQQWRRQW